MVMLRTIVGLAVLVFATLACFAEDGESPLIERPSLHFTPPSHWMNDPNGMVYYEGEYHLFYQHYPDGMTWGPMHWGHAVSKDLITWEHLPIALYPDEHGMIFSGSVVIDHENRSRLGPPGASPMVALFTYHNETRKRDGAEDFQTQGLAYSLDRGRSWVKYAGNPVLPNSGRIDFRDPKLSWNADSERWVMALAEGDRIGFYSSEDLLDWRHESVFKVEQPGNKGVWECPDLVRVRDPETGEYHDVLIVSMVPGGPNGGSGTQYFVGDFDGKQFVMSEQHGDGATPWWLDWGPDNYAGVTFANIESHRDHPLFLGWANNWTYATKIPATTWRSMMTVPRELSIHQASDGLRLSTYPAAELDRLLESVSSEEFEVAKSALTLPLVEDAVAHQFKLRLAKGDGSPLTVLLTNGTDEFTIVVSPETESVTIDRSDSGVVNFHSDFAASSRIIYPFDKEVIDVTLIYDANVIELYLDEGRASATALVFPRSRFIELRIKSANILAYRYQTVE